MRRALLSLLLFDLLGTGATACKTTGGGQGGLSAEAKMLVGTWRDSGGSGTTYVIERVKGDLVCTSAVDYDDEVFELQASTWTGSAFRFKYLVPSTGYIVSITTETIGRDEVMFSWENQYDSGTDTMIRVK